MKYTCLIYSEGGRDKKFLLALISLLEEYHAKKWSFNFSNAHGVSPEIILESCQKEVGSKMYNLILCFIDLDVLKMNYPKGWEEQKIELEKKYQNIIIIWQLDNAEEEYKRVLGEQNCNKYKINKMAKKEITKFKNSDLWKRILAPIKNKEKELNNGMV